MVFAFNRDDNDDVNQIEHSFESMSKRTRKLGLNEWNSSPCWCASAAEANIRTYRTQMNN